MSYAQWNQKDTDEVVKGVAIAALSAMLAEAARAGVDEFQGWLYRRRKQRRKQAKRSS